METITDPRIKDIYERVCDPKHDNFYSEEDVVILLDALFIRGYRVETEEDECKP